MPGNDLVFYGTTGPGGGADGGAQSDPNLYLGRFRSSTRLDEFQSTITVNQAIFPRARSVLIDATRIGDGADVHALKWLLIQTGPAALFASRIMAFDTATGRFQLENRTPAAVASGDFYAVFAPNNVWNDVTVAQAAAGDEQFRCISLRNEHGVAITNTKIFFSAVQSSGFEFSRLHQTNQIQPFIERADGVTDILDAFGQRDPLGGPDNFIGSGGWQKPQTRPIADTTIANLADVFSDAIWLRRTIPAGRRFRVSVAIMILAVTDVGGSDPDPLAGAAIMPFDIDGESPVATVEVDRFLHIAGGARLKGTAIVSGSPLVGKTVRFDVRAGDQGTIITANNPAAGLDVTDELGEADATFKSPTNPAFEGDLTHPQFIVGDGGEVGDP